MDINAAFKITAGVVGQQAVDKLNAGVATLDKQVSGLPARAKAAGLALAGIGAGLGIAVLKEKFDATVETILKVKEAAEQTGATIEKMGAIAQAAKVTGDDLDQITAGIVKMDKALAGADDSAKGAAHALEFLGLNIKDLRQMDPADAFDTIAKKMAEFEDGAGKTAIAMDIFGKSGAQLLPFMKDYVEIGDQVSKVTSAQAEQAEAYERNLRKLQAAKQELYSVIARQALPVADAFVRVLVETNNETNGVKQAAKDLAADGSMQRVFMEAARAAAALMDIMADLVTAVKQVGDSFAVVWKDIATAAKVAAIGIGAGFTEEGRKAIRETLDERNAYVEAANKRLQSRIDTGLTPFTDKLEKQFQRMKEEQANPPKEPERKSSKGYQSKAPSVPAGSKSDPYGDALNSMGAEAAKLKWQTEHIQQYSEKIDSAKEAVMRFETEQGKFKDLSDSQKAKLIEQAQAVDQYAEQLRQAKVGLEVTNQTKAIEANTQAMGLNTKEREMATFTQDLENKGVKAGTELYNELTAARRKALDAKDDARANPFLGIKEGLTELEDRTKDVAGNVKTVMVNAFDKAADALTDFVMTGKLNFSDFARSVLRDLASMIMRQMMFNALKAGLGGTGIGSLLGFAKGGAFEGGTQFFASGGVVETATPFRFASGGTMKQGVMGEAGAEAIMPLKRGKDGKLGVVSSGGQSSGGVSIGSIVVQNNGDATANDTSGKNGAQMGKAIAAAVQAEIIRQQRPGGLLYAA